MLERVYADECQTAEGTLSPFRLLNTPIDVDGSQHAGVLPHDSHMLYIRPVHLLIHQIREPGARSSRERRWRPGDEQALGIPEEIRIQL